MKRALALIFVLAMTLSLLAGCGGNNSTVSNGSSQNTAGDASGDSGKPYEGETLTVLYMSSVYADAARAMVDEFEEITGATVEVVDFPYVTLHEKALLDLTSGGTAAYDVIDVASQWDLSLIHICFFMTPFSFICPAKKARRVLPHSSIYRVAR